MKVHSFRRHRRLILLFLSAVIVTALYLGTSIHSVGTVMESRDSEGSNVTMVRIRSRRLVFSKLNVSSFKWLDYVFPNDPPLYGECLGAFISKTRFVTVAHCLFEKDEVMSVEYTEPNGGTNFVDARCLRNTWPDDSKGCNEVGAGDWGVCQVVGKWNATGIIEISGQLTEPRSLYLLTKRGSLHLGELSQSDSLSDCFQVSGGKDHGRDGDSGGAAYIRDGDRRRMVAVFSAIEDQSGSYRNWLSSVHAQGFEDLMSLVDEWSP